MSELDVNLAGKSLADFTNTQLRLALGAVLYTNTADMWKRYLNQLGYSGDVSQMLQKYYVEYSVPQNFRNYINAGAFIYSPQQLFTDGSKGLFFDNNDFVEPTSWRRNLLTYSEQFDNAVWTKSNASVTANAANNHLGVATADKLIPDAVSTQHRIDSPSAPVSSTTAYTVSCHAKADGYGFLVLRLRDAVSTADAIFNLSTGVVGAITISSWSAGSSSIESLGSGWYRCSFTATSNAAGATAGTGICRINVGNPSSNGDISAWAGNGTDGILIWGAQVEVGSTATTYQRITDFNSDFLAAFPSTTLFLDSAGTTAATVNGLVGLQLDKSLASITARRNLLSYSEQLGAAPWSGATYTITADQIAAPDGTVTADLVTATSAGGQVRQFFVSTAGIRTFSCYVKKGNVSVISFKIINIADAFTFNLDTGLVTGGIHAGTSFVENVGNGWYRIGCWLDTVAQTNYGPGIGLTSISDTVYAWGFQMEVGSTVSAYQKVVANEGGWMLGNHRYQTTTGSKPVLRGTPTGANLVTNGGFDTDTSWIKGAGWAIGSGVATKTAGAANTLYQLYSLVVGKTYRITYTVSGRTAGTCAGFLGSGTTVAGPLLGTNGTRVEYLTAVTGNAYYGITADSTFDGSIDNFEVMDVSAGAVTAPYGLQYDGVDDFLQTAAVDFTATDKMFVCAGVRKLSDAARAMFVELGNVPGTNTFRFEAPPSASPSYSLISGGSLTTFLQTASSFPAPVTNVATGIMDISGDSIRLRLNASEQTPVSLDQGTGNYGNHAFYFGRRGGTTLPYNGLDFGLVICGKTLTSTQISQTERYIAQRTGISI